MSFAGSLQGGEVEEVAVVYLGGAAPIAAILRNPTAHPSVSDEELDALRTELFEKRVVLP